MRFGGIWTFVIVTQVAVTLAFPATAFLARQYVVGIQSLDPGVPAAQYLTARLDADERLASNAALPELERRLEEEPLVAGVTFTSRLPRSLHPQRRIEVEDTPIEPETTASIADVALDYFGTLSAPPLTGRHFNSGDLAAGSRAVIVNNSFVQRVLGGRNPVGLRVRYAARADAGASPWYEIVGVVRDLGVVHENARNGAGVYHPLDPQRTRSVHMVVHAQSDPEALAPRVRAVATAVDPALRVHDLLTLDRVGSTLWLETAFLFRLLVLVSAIALLLSLAGIYSVMSLTVSRRTREIGIRIALGADARRIVSAVFRRALAQVGVGVLAGGVLVFALTEAIAGLSAANALAILAYMALMLGVCLIACVVPTRRALDIEPKEMLKAEC